MPLSWLVQECQETTRDRIRSELLGLPHTYVKCKSPVPANTAIKIWRNNIDGINTPLTAGEGAVLKISFILGCPPILIRSLRPERIPPQHFRTCAEPGLSAYGARELFRPIELKFSTRRPSVVNIRKPLVKIEIVILFILLKDPIKPSGSTSGLNAPRSIVSDVRIETQCDDLGL